MATRRSQLTRDRAKTAQSFVTLAKSYEIKKHGDLTGWAISEKLDGVRARWIDGELLSRSKKIFPAPDTFKFAVKDAIGTTPVDGELYCGRGSFQDTVSIVRSSKKPFDWKLVLYIIFDVAYTADIPWNKRMECLQDIGVPMFRPSDSFTWSKTPCRILQHHILEKEDSLPDLAENVIDLGGEGVMLRDPSMSYVFGRSKQLLKYKPFHDMEVEVSEIQKGDGRNIKRMGALICKIPQKNKVVKVGTGFSDDQREKPPKVGQIITIKYQELTRDGIPRHPVFVRIRESIDL